MLVVLSLRIMGKKQLGELQPSELVTTIIISNIATLSLEEANIPLLAGIIPILAIVCLDVFMSAITLKMPRFRRFIAGSPRILIAGGEINQSEMKNLRYTIDDMMEAMRTADIFNIADVQYAIAETTGKISFFEKPAEAPVGVSPAKQDPHEIIIKDGVVNHSGLLETGLDEHWLAMLLNEKQVSPKGVFLLTADKNGAYNYVEMNKKRRRGSAN